MSPSLAEVLVDLFLDGERHNAAFWEPHRVDDPELGRLRITIERLEDEA